MKTIYLGLGSNWATAKPTCGWASSGWRRRTCAWCAPRRCTRPSRRLHPPGLVLNLVVEAETDLFPMQLLARAGKIERALGRVRTVAKGRGPSISTSCSTAGPWCAAPRWRFRTRGWLSGASCWRRWRTWRPACATRDAPDGARDAGSRAGANGTACYTQVYSARPLRSPEEVLGLRLVPAHAGSGNSFPKQKKAFDGFFSLFPFFSLLVPVFLERG